MKKAILWVFLFMLFPIGPSTSFAQDKGREWVESTGEAVISNITPFQARQRALAQARFKAIQQVGGIEVSGLQYVSDMMLENEAIFLFSVGEIVDESIQKWEIQVDQDSETVFPELLCRVKYRAKVIIKGEPDPNFRMDASLNNERFNHGDEIVVKMKCTSDCYITVLNLQYNDQIVLLVPSRFKNENFLKAHKTLEIPSKQERNFWRFTAQAVPGVDEVNEAIFVIATKKKVDFLLDDDDEAYPRVPFTEFQRWLSLIPMSDRSQVILGYEVFGDGNR